MSYTSEIEDIEINVQDILNDYRIAVLSREASLMGRKEVFMGKAKFGIFGDGKEVAQIAMAKAFQIGDFRSGYYRDQTFMFAAGELTVQEFFAQLYAHTDVVADPSSGGRSMNGHFATRFLDEKGLLKPLSKLKNSSSDISPTAGQIPRLVGLAYASKIFKQNKDLHALKNLSLKGKEVAFGTIGNAATSEGMFLEAINAAGVLQIPMVMSVWDDGYGISVPNELHTTKESISKALEGFRRSEEYNGIEIITVKGWDYPGLVTAYKEAASLARREHVPVLIHVEEMTQPQGHSTSGSHERYKPKERLAWELEYDCILKMREWILAEGFSTEEELESLEKQTKTEARESRLNAWHAFINSLKNDQKLLLKLIDDCIAESANKIKLNEIRVNLEKALNPLKLDFVLAAKKALRVIRKENFKAKRSLTQWLAQFLAKAEEDYSSHLYSESELSALNIVVKNPQYSKQPQVVDGREVLQACFDKALERDPKILAFGEDVGKIGDVNQAFAGLQDKYGDNRVIDTGIREMTIIGQGIGLALRGLKPIAEIQYLDYVAYALATLTDDLACLHYRTKGGQKAPLIIRTRGHRLEGVFHSGSPMGMLLHSLRGIYLLVPRNMTIAASFYNTLFKSDDAALVVECLNGYRLKEKLPNNVGEMTAAFGVPEVIREGSDITIVTYGSMCRIVMEAASQLKNIGISCEVVDVQTLLPFDIHHKIVESIQKTNRVIFADEDMPGGASAYMMQEVLEKQKAYQYLDSQPCTISAKPHRPAYSSDGDYFSKPNVEDVYDKVYEIMAEVDPAQFPNLYD